MVFASITFLWIFLPAVLILYYLLQVWKKQKMQNFLLLFASLLFYSFGEPRLILLLLCCVLANYLGGLIIAGSKKLTVRTLALTVTLAMSLGMLGYFKYFNFFIDAMNSLTGMSLSVKRIALPIGISFYTFQALSYTIDLYRGRCEVQRSFWKLLLYISFFPQLIAGPIVRYRDIADEIDDRSVSFDLMTEGISRFISGLGKKVLLANVFAVRADLIFSMPDVERTPALAWVGVLMYSMQIYFDFSGYSDMAIGMGRMFGFHFLENFNMPYTAQSITEFWRRWHISLSTWFKEYLYIPLGGNRKGNIRTCINLLIVFFLTGLWHGAGWNFIAWGMLHGLLIVLERLLRANVKVSGTQAGRIAGHVYTLLAVSLAWIFFRAENITAALGYFKTLVTPARQAWSVMEILETKGLFVTLIGILMCGIIPGELQKSLRESVWFKAAVLPILLFLCIMYLAADSYNPFIYFRF